MAKRIVPFNARAFWESIKDKKCKRKLNGARILLARVMKKEVVTEDMVSCMAWLRGRLDSNSVKEKQVV